MLPCRQVHVPAWQHGCREQDRQMEDTEKLGGWQTYKSGGGPQGKREREREREREKERERGRGRGRGRVRDERWTVKDTRPHEGRLKRPSPYILSRNDRGKASGEGGEI